MLEEHGYTAGCLKCTCVRERRPAAGTCHSEGRRARFEALLRSIGDPGRQRGTGRRAHQRAPGAEGAVECGGCCST
eukprot:11230526-Alexandrium_andersonii.AAC.1